jgi:hypothetical protein
MTRKEIIFILPAFLYIVLSLMMGEVHPFSRYEMYSSFPSTAFCLSVTDTNGKLLPVKQYFDYSAFTLLHNYHTVLPVIGQQFTNQDSVEHHVAATLVHQMLSFRKSSALSAYQIRLHTFFKAEQRINSREKVIYTYVANARH